MDLALTSDRPRLKPLRYTAPPVRPKLYQPV